ncbi:MAG: hypothetical protein O7F71_19180 [Gammaproteobacteria bacterium]|nr:hypothetical protein [Gammaproteobacteria bacterium]
MTRKITLAGVLLLGCGIGGVFAQTPQEAALQVMEDFLSAFNSRDEQAWADTLHFPHVRLASGRVRVYSTSADFVAATDLDGFAESSGWDHSVWDNLEVVQVSAQKVHIAVTFSRFTAAGDKLASYPSFYVIEKLDGRWGVRARSSFAP